MNVLCIDIGNTHTHFGRVCEIDADIVPATVATAELDRPGGPLAREIDSTAANGARASGIAFCSVVPEAEERLRRLVGSARPGLPVFQLTRKTLPPGVRIHYPRPDEIGQDRLANVVAACRLVPLPCVVIDLGTAVTFDILSARHGYEGGIIAPGIAVMTGYLHQQTALLPQLDEDFRLDGAIGKSTREAMRIGCVLGFRGMLEALLNAVREELARIGEPDPSLVLTGGAADFLFDPGEEKRNNPPWKGVLTIQDLTLKGLAYAFREAFPHGTSA